LWKDVLSGLVKQVRWNWTWRIERGHSAWRIHDSAQTKEAAQAQIEAQWRAWLEAAGLSEQ
jgi:hypothetical protein